MSSGIYSRFKANLMNGVVDLEADDIEVALYDNSHNFNEAHTVYTPTNEIDGDGYTAGGKTLANKTVTEAEITKWDANDVAWTTATFSAWNAVIYDSTAANNLIASIDFGGEKVVAGGTFTIQFDAAGIITLAG